MLVPGYSRDLSRSLAAWAARSSPVGSKLLHLSLGLSPPPDPPEGGGGGGGCGGTPDGASGCPLFNPKSQDMFEGGCYRGVRGRDTGSELSRRSSSTRFAGALCACASGRANKANGDWLRGNEARSDWLFGRRASAEVVP